MVFVGVVGVVVVVVVVFVVGDVVLVFGVVVVVFVVVGVEADDDNFDDSDFGAITILLGLFVVRAGEDRIEKLWG